MGRGEGLGEALAVWAVHGAVALAVVVTYSRLPADELYNVSREGLAGGLGRALVLVGYPVALAAVPVTLLAVDRLGRNAWPPAAVSIALCATIVWPGVVDEHDLDPKPVNALAAVGVALSLALTAAAVRRHGAAFAPALPGDRLRFVLATVLLVAALPWIAVELGFHLPGDVLLSEEEDADGLAAVHLGHHHGTDGVVLAATALLLSRAGVAGRRLAVAFAAYVSLLFAYGLANAVEDGWHEQVVKRGWADWRFPSALRPEPTPFWGVILLSAAAVYVLALRPRRPR